MCSYTLKHYKCPLPCCEWSACVSLLYTAWVQAPGSKGLGAWEGVGGLTGGIFPIHEAQLNYCLLELQSTLSLSLSKQRQPSLICSPGEWGWTRPFSSHSTWFCLNWPFITGGVANWKNKQNSTFAVLGRETEPGTVLSPVRTGCSESTVTTPMANFFFFKGHH